LVYLLTGIFNFLNTLLHLLATISPILLRTNTNKFDSLKYPTLFTSLIVGSILYYYRIGIVISSSLILFYSVAVSLGIIVFMRKYDYVKSLSLSVALAFVASGVWEIPIILYTVAYRGYIDGAFPLHVIYIIPLLLLMSDIRIEVSRINIMTALLMMLFNCTMLGIHIKIHGANIWIVRGFTTNILLWVSRPVTVAALYSIYYRGELKR